VTSIDIHVSAAVRLLSCIHIDLHIFCFTLQSRTLQESLANAKVSAGQHCVYEGHLAKKSTANERKEHNIEKYIQLLTTLSLTILLFIRLAVVASEICEIL